MKVFEFNIVDDSVLETVNADTVHAFFYSDFGAMGEWGKIKYFCVEGNAIYIYDGSRQNTKISDDAVEKLHDQLYDMDMNSLFPKRDWYCFELGCGNHLYMKPCYKDIFDKSLEKADEHIYLCYDKIIISILQGV